MKNSLHRNKITAILTGTMILISSLLAMQNSVQAAPVTNGLIYLDQGSSNPITAVNADGTSGTVIQPLTNQCAKYPSFSLDGKKVAWVDGCSSPSTLKVANTDGSNVISVGTSSSINRPKLSADGTVLFFVTNSGADVYRIDATTANPNQTGTAMQVGANSDPYSISSTGKIAYIAYGGGSCGNGVGGVFVRAISGTGPGTFVPGSCSSNSGVDVYSTDVAWSSDGAKMYIAQRSYDGINSSRGKPVINRFTETGVDGPTFFEHSTIEKTIDGLSISPDGINLAFMISDRNGEQESASILNLSTQVATVVIPTLNSRTRSLFWAPLMATTTPVQDVTPPAQDANATVPGVSGKAPTTTTPPVASADYDSAVPGITVTDTKVYQIAPKEVAGKSAIMVLSTAQNKIADVVSKTPSICLPSDNDLVFIDEGRCIAEVVNVKTRKVLRTLKTTVVADDISELEVGNEIAILTPLYFVAGTFDLKAQSLSRLTKLKDRVTAAGSVLVAGHSGVLMGNTPENLKLAKERADATVKILKARGAKGPFAVTSVGALDPVTKVKTQAAQEKNRRVVIVLIP